MRLVDGRQRRPSTKRFVFVVYGPSHGLSHGRAAYAARGHFFPFTDHLTVYLTVVQLTLHGAIFFPSRTTSRIYTKILLWGDA